MKGGVKDGPVLRYSTERCVGSTMQELSTFANPIQIVRTNNKVKK